MTRRRCLFGCLGLLVVLILATLACGPSSSVTGEAEDSDRPTTTPEPTPESTEEPVPTRHPDDPPSPTPTVLPTYPPRTPGPTSVPIPVVPHPKGLVGCLSMNMFTMTGPDLDYMHWCNESLRDDVRQNCRDRDGHEAQLACAKERLSDSQMPYRANVLACSAITDIDARGWCINGPEGAVNAASDATYQIWNIWPLILSRVDGDDEVKQKRQDVAECVFQRGYEKLVTTPPFYWQTMSSPSNEKPERGAPAGEESEARRIRYRVMDGCARQSGIYDVQEALWLAEIERLEREDPASVKALVDSGIKIALKAEGPAPFLTYRER